MWLSFSFLMEQDINARTYEEGRTPLMWAAFHGHLDVVRLLLSKGVDVNARGQTW